MAIGGTEIPVRPADPKAFEGVDLAFFAAGAEIAQYYVPRAVQSGAVAIDASAAFRTEPGVPLIVPEVNPEDIDRHEGIISNPNCSTVQLALVLHPLNKANRIVQVVVSTYQSVSGAGAAGVEELTRQCRLALGGRPSVPHVFRHQIAFNVLPEVDVFLHNGFTREEWKLAEETRSIMHSPDMFVTATCARVPVYVGHCQAVHIEFTAPIAPEDVRRLLAAMPGVKVVDDTTVSLYPQPRFVAHTDEVTVGRVRQDPNSPTRISLWTVADNLRKGTAVNAVQIAEEMVRRGRLHVRKEQGTSW